jgi:hypothetical protein
MGCRELAWGLIRLILAEPTLLPAAPPDAGWAEVERRCGESHPCLHCGRPAGLALIVTTRAGMRWLDLCPPCGEWLRA